MESRLLFGSVYRRYAESSVTIRVSRDVMLRRVIPFIISLGVVALGVVAVADGFSTQTGAARLAVRCVRASPGSPRSTAGGDLAYGETLPEPCRCVMEASLWPGFSSAVGETRDLDLV